MAGVDKKRVGVKICHDVQSKYENTEKQLAVKDRLLGNIKCEIPMADQDEPGCTEAIFAQTIPGMLVTDQDGHGIGTGGSLIKAGLGSV